MPENNKNLADGRTTNIIQALGEATMWGDGTTPDKDNPYGMYYNNDNFTSARDKKFFQEDKAPITRNDPNCPINYSFDEKTCIPKIPYIGISLGNLDPTFMSFLNYVYDNTNFLTTSQNTLMDSDYQISYNKIPLKSDDETYTYLDATKIGENSSTRILGLKNNSQYVNLIDAGGINLNNLIDDLHTTKAIKDGYNPIIINAYAQHKYKLKVGDIIKFNINNKTDRIEQQITSSSIDSSIPFKVVGINTTYQGEEYFTNQQLANQILGLRNNFSDSYNLHNYYFNSEKQDSVTKTWYSETINTEKNPASVVYDLMDLSDINSNNEYLNPALNYINDGESLGKITPLGFNGVFTKKTNGSSVLNCGQYLYAPSGIYPGNDALDSDVVKNVLRQSANLEIANIVSGLIKTDIGKKINNDFLT
jgi:putative ABC transport system permease protein